MVSEKWFESRFEAMMEKMDSMQKEHRESINSLKKDHRDDIDSLKKDHRDDIDSLKIEHRESMNRFETQIITLEAKIQEQDQEIAMLKSRVTAVEERLALIDEMLSTIAPFVRELLESEDSMLLNPDYKELRDSLTKEQLSTAKDILIKCEEYDRHKERYVEPAKAFGQRLSSFYQNVLGYAPRKLGQYRYLLEAEQVIVDNVLRVWSKLA